MIVAALIVIAGGFENWSPGLDAKIPAAAPEGYRTLPGPMGVGLGSGGPGLGGRPTRSPGPGAEGRGSDLHAWPTL